MIICFFFFFFKQKTAYEIQIRDWSSDVCSSDLNLFSQCEIRGAANKRKIGQRLNTSLQTTKNKHPRIRKHQGA